MEFSIAVVAEQIFRAIMIKRNKMGLKVGEVKLEKWNPKWRDDFEKEKQNLLNIFGTLALDIQHIGSTSVEGLDAKPIIDIAVGLGNLTDFEEVRQTFENLPAYSIKEDNVPDEILVRKGPENDRTHFIHVMEYQGQRMNDSLQFRNILRQNSQLKDEYCKLKHQLAIKYPNDRKIYTSSKASFIKETLKGNEVV